MKKYFERLFVVLVYKNLNDISNFIPQVQRLPGSNRIIIVESFYNKECTEALRNIASREDCDFCPVKNGGYGYGNNRGIEYAFNNYDFDYLIICNADIDILEIPTPIPDNFQGKVIAPEIKTISGKMQNPFWAKENSCAEKLMYLGEKKNIMPIAYLGFGIYKIERQRFLQAFYSDSMEEKTIAAAHGAFVVFSEDVLKKIGLPYDENMFLFAEECLLSHVLKNNEIETIMTRKIKIRHHEDGSMNAANVKQMEERRKSIIYYYEKERGK